MKQFLFYQHNVQQFFIRHRDKFSGVIAPLSIASSFPDGTHGFLQALFAEDQGKQFLIDPRSPLFQKAWNRQEYVRNPHKKAANIFGPPFTTYGLESKLEIENLTEDALLNVTKAAIEYQQKFRFHKQDQKKIAKYKKLLGVATLPEFANPQLYIPPYFEFAAVEDGWCKASLTCIKQACSFEKPSDIRPVLHFGNFDKIVNWAPLINSLQALGIKSAFLYPNNFREHVESVGNLKKYAEMVHAFESAGIEPFALHGGYFSIALAKQGMGGFGNGVGYGEWRDSGYHRGGTAEKRIYILKLHRFLEPAKAQTLINVNPDYFALDTDLLSACHTAERPLDDISQEEALNHFMDCRMREMTFVAQHDIAAIKHELDTTVGELKNKGPEELQKVYIASLSAWGKAIETW